MADLERKYIIPLRREFLKVQKYRRTQRAVNAVRKFVQKHMKSDNVKILRELNEVLNEHGRKNPPHKIEVKVKKVESKEESYVLVNLVNAPLELKKKEVKKETLVDRMKGAVTGKKEEKKETAEEKKEEAFKEEKKEVLEHAPHPEVKHHDVSKLKEGIKPSPKSEKIIGQTGKK